MARIEVAPDVLRWARDRAGVPLDTLTARFRQYRKWEAGEGGPTDRQLDQLASVLRLPVGMLFLAHRPQEDELPIPDFRRMAGSGPVDHASIDLVDTIHICQRRQQWYRAHLVGIGAPRLSFVGSASIDDDVSLVAGRIRATLGLEIGKRNEASNWEEFLRDFIKLARASGILVMVNGVVGNNTRRVLSPQEFRGFAIADDHAPLVFINGADTKAAQIFTLAHEVSHLWLGKSGISLVRASDLPERYEPDATVERWCNSIAAEILVPIAALREMNLSGGLDVLKSSVARTFRVSTLVALRRLKDIGRINYDTFSTAYAEELAYLKSIAPKGGGGDFYNNMGSRVDPRFATAVIGSAFEGTTLMGEALRLLGVKSTHVLRKEAQHLGVSA